MKKAFLLLTTLAVFTACKSDDEAPDPGNYQTPLPQATQTGKGTFACYVDGMAYIAEKHQITSYYQYTQGHYAFSVSGAKEEKPLFSIIVGLSSDGLIVGTTYDLKDRKKGNPWGGVFCLWFG